MHLWFRLMEGLQTKSTASQRNRATHKMADMRYYGNVMTTSRWRLYVTMETLWLQQDGGYALVWKRYPNIQITLAPSRMLVAYTQIGPYKYNSKKVVRVMTMLLCDGRT